MNELEEILNNIAKIFDDAAEDVHTESMESKDLV